MSVSSMYLGWWMTVYFTRHSYNKCFYNMCATECLCEVKAIWVRYSSSIVWMCLCGWSVHQVPRDLEASPVGLGDENTDFSFTTLNAFCIVPLWQHAKVQPLFLMEYSSHVALYWGFNPQCCTSKLRSHVDLKVCLNVRTDYLIFCFCLTINAT